MSDVRGFESAMGTMQYFPKKQICQCCHIKKNRTAFIVRYSYKDDYDYSMSHVCNKCREPFAMPTTKMAFRKSGERCEDISNPSIIDWMYKNIKD